MKTMLDVAGNELSVGQRVAMTVSGYEELKVGTIYGFTPKKVKVMYGPKEHDEVLRFPNQVAILK